MIVFHERFDVFWGHSLGQADNILEHKQSKSKIDNVIQKMSIEISGIFSLKRQMKHHLLMILNIRIK